MKNYSYLIIGNSTAAAGAVDGIRSADRGGSIAVVSREPCEAYSRPLISYLVEGRTDREKMRLRSDEFYEKNGVERILGVEALSIDVGRHAVALSSGETVGYGKLLVATGSIPFVPPTEGMEKVKKRFSFMTVADAESLAKAVSCRSRVLVLGGGLIGLKCAEAIADRAGEIVVVDLAGRILSSVLDDECAAVIQKKFEERGVKFRLGVSAAKFEENSALLSDGSSVEFDVLVTAVGVRSETALVRNAGGEVARGIVTDAQMRTTLTDVYAAGDCADSFDISSGERRVLAILPNAYRGGYAAGINMAGGAAEFVDSMPLNATGFFGLHFATCGTYSGECFIRRSGENIAKLYCGEKLNGFILLGDIDRAGIYASLVRSAKPVKDIDWELMRGAPTLAALPREERDAALAKSPDSGRKEAFARQ